MLSEDKLISLIEKLNLLQDRIENLVRAYKENDGEIQLVTMLRIAEVTQVFQHVLPVLHYIAEDVDFDAQPLPDDHLTVEQFLSHTEESINDAYQEMKDAGFAKKRR